MIHSPATHLPKNNNVIPATKTTFSTTPKNQKKFPFPGPFKKPLKTSPQAPLPPTRPSMQPDPIYYTQIHRNAQ
jgi:hypothetical protein